MIWSVDFTPVASRDFDRLDGTVQNRVSRKIDEIEDKGPLIAGVKMLHSADRLHRVRVGDWRIIYQVDFKRRVITIAHIVHRSEAYR
jgi:mRNA-degrading endonuclease RelE of RelBE toxin-antitoxin system